MSGPGSELEDEMSRHAVDGSEADLFGRRLRGLQRRDGFSIFHANEFKAKAGEFAGWGDTKCMKLVNDLTELVRDHLTEGLTVHLERERYLNEYRAPPIPKKMTLDSQYGVCFRACMRQLLEMIWRDNKRHRLDIVIEDGHLLGEITVAKVSTTECAAAVEGRLRG